MIRVWFKLDGKVESCVVKATTITQAKRILKENISGIKIGWAEKIQG